MYRGNTVGVVVPAYNEEEFVGDVLSTMPEFVDRVYAVDDCSTDGTWVEIQACAELSEGREKPEMVNGGRPTRPEVVPIRHAENRGVGAAIKTGYLRSLDDEIDVTAVMGGDGQMDPDHLDRIIDPVVEGRGEYARGNRLLFSENRRDMPLLRVVGNVMLTFLTKVASGYWTISDPQSGYTAISLDALQAIDIEEIFEFYGYCNDLLVRLNVHDMRVVDVQIPANYGDETSHIHYPTYVRKVSGMLLRDFLWRLKTKYVVRDFHPLVLLYALGHLGALGTLGLVLRELLDRDERTTSPGEVLTGLLVSGALLAAAMVLDKQANEDLDRTELHASRTASRTDPSGPSQDGHSRLEQ